MDAWKLELDEEASDVEGHGRVAEYIEGITFVGWLLFASIVGEGAALAALASRNPHFVYLLLVLVAICFQLTCLGGVVLTQAVDRLEEHDARKATLGYILVASASSSSSFSSWPQSYDRRTSTLGGTDSGTRVA